MTQSNIFLEDENSVIYVNVLPDVEDTVTEAASSASISAASASASVTTASALVESIRNIKTGVEVFVSQALENLRDLYSNISTTISSLGETFVQNINSSYSLAIHRILQTEDVVLTNIRSMGSRYVDEAQSYARAAGEIVDFHVSTEHLNQSKGILTGDISDDSVMMANVKSYAHSTFDARKFTFVGNPIVTIDGIASGFSSGNYITFNPTYTVNDYVQYEFGIDTPSTIPTGSWGIDGSIFFRIYNNVSGSYETTVLCVDGTAKLRMIAQYVGVELATLQPNTSYNMLAKFYINGNYEIKFYTNGELQTFTGTGAVAMSTAGGYCGIGCGMSPDGTGAYGFSQYPIDLKQFSITVDGVPVFSGNKTGIDTIKPDDYTVVGSPTISADGVVSGFSQGEYIQCNNNPTDIANATNWEIEVSFTTNANDVSDFCNILDYHSDQWKAPCLGIDNGYLRWNFSFNNTGWDVIETLLQITANTKYNIKYGFTGSQYYIKYNNTTWDNEFITLSTYSSTNKVYCAMPFILGNYGTVLNRPFSGSIDLNAFKIYIDGDLVYQPCLKIPYTESKTGSKVVDANYRNRVNDVYEQGYLQRYYTLDENNRNFTLPQGEIYGMIEQLRYQIEMLNSGS